MGVNSLPKTVTRQRRRCDLNLGASAPESSTLTTRLPITDGYLLPAPELRQPGCTSLLLLAIGRRPLRSARTNRLLVLPVKLSTVGGRAFPVAKPTIWNSLPDNVISAPSLSTFRQRLKTFPFQVSFSDIIIDPRLIISHLQWILE